MGGGGGIGDLGDLGGEEGKEGEGEESENGEEKPPVPEGKPEDIVKEERIKPRDQSGEHDANDHPFGEDPLGQLGMNSDTKKNSEGRRKSVLYHNFEKKSPFSLEETKKDLHAEAIKDRTLKSDTSDLITMLGDFFKKTETVKQELLRETTRPISMLDENNIKG